MRIRPHWRHLAAIALLPILAAASLASAAEPEVLKQIPGDAYGMLVINNTRAFANKISNAATRLNLPVPPDLVGYATRNLGITEGFDANGSAAVIFLKPHPERADQPYFNDIPPAIVLLPTNDSAKLLAPFKPGTPDAQGIIEVTLPQNLEEKGYVAVVDNKWVALAQNKKDLAAYLTRGNSFAASAAESTRKVFDTNDLVIWGNVEKLGGGLDKWIDDRQTEMIGMMELATMARKLDAVEAAMQKQSLTLGFSFIKQLFKDAKATMLTVRITDSGATLGLVGDFKADSEIGKFVASQATQEPISLKGLPTGNFLGAFAGRWNGPAIANVYAGVMEKLINDPALANDPRAATMKQSFEAARQIMGITQGARFVLLDPPAGGNSGFLNGAALIETADPQRLVDNYLRTAAAMTTAPATPGIRQEVTVTQNAITIKDIRFHKINVKMTLLAEAATDPAMQVANAVIQKIFGTEGLTAYIGIVGRRVLVLYGSNQPTLEAAVDAAAADSDLLSTQPMIQQTKDQVVANPVFVAYLPVTRWMLLAQSIIKPPAAGDPAPPATVVSAPPVIMSAGINGQMLTGEIHVPISTIIGIQDGIVGLESAIRGAGGGLPQP